ncbi:hypothetical protein R3P38DRAFT_1297044 [Favolaschia claudopus]|uniref:DUF6533 domain-containing protein n=1 Tax=Favolaschia claudopus TaxID=2862362 RepID=A0AAW0AXC0_9AGAR
MPDYTTVLIQAQWERNCQLAAAIILAYEYFLHLPKEINLFWRRRWTIAKGLFIWSRYYSLAFNSGNAIIFMQSHPSEELCVVSVGVKLNGRFYPFFEFRCAKFFRWQNCGAIIQPTTTQLILSLRIYAMYARNRKILLFLCIVILGQIIGQVILFDVPRAGLVAENNPALGLYICADGDPPNVHWMAYVPLINILAESIFLSLALFKAYQQRKIPGRIIPRLTKESIFFFVAILGLHTANLTVWMINNLTTNELVTGFAFSIPAALANRLLISAREPGKFDLAVTLTEDTDSSALHVRFARSRAEGEESGTETDVVELRSFRVEVGQC